MTRPSRSNFPTTDAGEIAFWAAYRLWQSYIALRRI